VSVLVSVRFAGPFVLLRGDAGAPIQESPIKRAFFVVERCAAGLFVCLQNGFVGINSEVPYRLDHAPTLGTQILN